MIQMDAFRIIAVLSIWLGPLLGLLGPLQPQADLLEARLDVLQDSGTVGAGAIWLVTLLPAQGAVIDDAEILPADTLHWKLGAPVKTGPVPPTGQVYEISAIPLLAEKSVPAVVVHFYSGTGWKDVYALASGPLDVRSVEDRVSASLTVHQKMVRGGSQVDIDLQVANRSPVSLQAFHLADESAGLVIDPTDTQFQSLRPFETSPVYHFQARVAPGVSAGEVQPSIRLDYTWKSDTGKAIPGSLLVNGEALAVQPTWWQGSEMRGYLLGLIGALLATTLTRLIEEWLTRRRNTRTNRERVISVLSRLINRTRNSATIGSAIELSEIEIIYSDSDLFRQMVNLDLKQDVEQSWAAAERFNEGIAKPGGAQRKEMLLGKIDQLEKHLKPVGEKRGKDSPSDTVPTGQK